MWASLDLDLRHHGVANDPANQACESVPDRMGDDWLAVPMAT